MGFVLASIQGCLYGRHLGRMPEKPSPHSIGYDMDLKHVLEHPPGSHAGDAARDFLTHLAICNTVIPNQNADGELLYQVKLHELWQLLMLFISKAITVNHRHVNLACSALAYTEQLVYGEQPG